MNWSGIRRVAEPRQVIASDFSPRKTERPKIESRGATTASITRAPVAASRLGVLCWNAFLGLKPEANTCRRSATILTFRRFETDSHLPSLRD